jgi:hypothetical protein
MASKFSLVYVMAFAASVTILGATQAATVVQTRAPPPRVVRAPVARPMMAHPGVPAKPGAPGTASAKAQGGPGGAAGATAHATGAAPDPRAQLMEMVHPGMPSAAVKPVSAMHAEPNMHGPTARTAFTRPSNIRHNPEHHVGHVGDAHRHAAFMFARGDHHFYRRYYVQDGAWYWYDEPAAVDDPAFATAQDLPTCDPNADECQGDVVPLAGPPPNAAYAPTDSSQGQ